MPSNFHNNNTVAIVSAAFHVIHDTFPNVSVFIILHGENQWELLGEMEICTVEPVNAMTFSRLAHSNTSDE